ncbi:proline imino-peptidase [Exidia glandulosa HHB12029]|uniref:Proline imino-peptidase n=1 Tax=Exidia glandulosa HHB12029 TaxID=1314781 RepID=A0A165EL37_EXIGL|nr:proline imino-peptidase [Exidia glandulosa HHB12029]
MNLWILAFATVAFASQSILMHVDANGSRSPTLEGDAPFDVPAAGAPTFTHYKVFGTLNNSSAARPLVVAHGGPGVPHNYLLSLADLSQHMPVILYDQLGAGLSTHLKAKNGDTSFWTEQLFMDELDNLLVHLGIENDYALLGHSWGGMLASRFATRAPSGLKKLVLASSPSDTPLWVEALQQLVKGMPQDMQDALNSGDESTPEFAAALNEFYARHVCRLDPMPQDIADAFGALEEDNTVYITMWGPSELQPVGPLKTWSVVDELHKISAPTLVTSGFYDEAQPSAIQPFLDNISNVRWHQFKNSSHMAHYEQREEFMQVVAQFLLTQ